MMEFRRLIITGALHDIEILNMQNNTVKVVTLQKAIPCRTTETFNIDDSTFAAWLESNKQYITHIE